MAQDPNLSSTSGGIAANFRIIVSAVATTISVFVRRVSDVLWPLVEPFVRLLGVCRSLSLAAVARLQAMQLRRAWLLAWRLPVVPLVRLPERTRVCAASSRYAVAYW